jgi:hypothetical protein
VLEELMVQILFFEKYEFEDMGPFQTFSKNGFGSGC